MFQHHVSLYVCRRHIEILTLYHEFSGMSTLVCPLYLALLAAFRSGGGLGNSKQNLVTNIMVQSIALHRAYKLQLYL